VSIQEPLPHHITLPQSHSNVPTVFTAIPNHVHGQSEPHEIPLPEPRSRAPTIYSPEPHEIPLPVSRHYAPTAYTAQSPRSITNTPDRKAHVTMPSVSVIDYAVLQPLPLSRGTTMFGSPKVNSMRTTTIVVGHFITRFISRQC
jgi:hypothetical protein